MSGRQSSIVLANAMIERETREIASLRWCRSVAMSHFDQRIGESEKRKQFAQRFLWKIPAHEWVEAVRLGRTSYLLKVYDPSFADQVYAAGLVPRCPPWASRKYRDACLRAIMHEHNADAVRGSSPWQTPTPFEFIARRRAGILAEVEQLVSTGIPKGAAIGLVASNHKVSGRSISSWFSRVAGLGVNDRAQQLCPRYKGGGKRAHVESEALEALQGYLRGAGNPSFRRAYQWLLERYPNLPSEKTLRRRLKGDNG
jgi:hypothetical protein